MATGDTELAVRVAVIQVLGAIDERSLLEEDEREKLCLLVFDEEAKVRKAVGQFVKAVWDEAVDERLSIKKKPSEKDKERTGIKVFGSLLVKWGKVLDKATVDGRVDADGADKESLSSGEGNSRARNPQVVSLMGSVQKGRTALAVEALWHEVESVRDWELLLDVLLLDHSAGGEEGTGPTQGRKTHVKQAVERSAVDDVWRLEEVEETLLLEALLAALIKVRAEVGGAKKVGMVQLVSRPSTECSGLF
jgi:cohesin complex subunit SA-1/2